MRPVKLMVNSRDEVVAPQKVERFSKRMEEVWRHVTRKNFFTLAEERVLNALANYLQMNTNAIVTPGGDYMTIDEMARQTGIDRSNLRKWVKSLIRKNAIGKWVSGQKEAYFINPHLYQKGEVKPFVFYLFDEEAAERVQKESNVVQFRAGKKRTSLLQVVDGGEEIA